MDNDPNLKFVEGSVCIVRVKRQGYDYLPVLPSRRGDDTIELKEGIILNCLGLKEVQPGVFFYEMEVVTGSKAGDTVWVGHQLVDLLDEIPSHNRLR